MTDTETPADETVIEFPNRFAKLFAQAAIKRDAERQAQFRSVVELARLDPTESIDRIVTLADTTHVFKVIGLGQTLYGAIVLGKLDNQRFYSLDEALLRAIALRHGAGLNDQGHIYAARALGVVPTVDEQRQN